MKLVLLMMAVMLVVGCPANRKPPHHGKEVQSEENCTATKPVKELTAEGVVGSYERKASGITTTIVLIEGISYFSSDGEDNDENPWELVGKEVHLQTDPLLSFVYKIEPNGDLTWIADISDGKRKDYPKEGHWTYKRIK